MASVLLSHVADEFSFHQNSHFKYAFNKRFHIWTHSALHMHTSACTNLPAWGDRAHVFSVKQSPQVVAHSKPVWGSQHGYLSSAFLYQMSFRYLHQNSITYLLQAQKYWPSFLLLRCATTLQQNLQSPDYPHHCKLWHLLSFLLTALCCSNHHKTHLNLTPLLHT